MLLFLFFIFLLIFGAFYSFEQSQIIDERKSYLFLSCFRVKSLFSLQKKPIFAFVLIVSLHFLEQTCCLCKKRMEIQRKKQINFELNY